MSRRGFWLAGGVVLATAAGAFLHYYLNGVAQVPAGYVAKTLCSEIFLAGRPEAVVRAGEFSGINPVLDHVRARADKEAKAVSAALYGLGRSRAIYRDGYGCAIARGPLAPLPPLEPMRPGAPWPEARADSVSALPRVDYAAIENALDAAMADARAAHRALLVVVDGALVAERYADGFDAATPFLSWSMAKSVTATIVGAAVLRRHIDITDPAPVEEWRDDPARAAITWNDLLRMQSGLAFDENYADPRSDVNRMLFREADAGAAAARRPLVHPPGDHWSYSSGTTNLIARTLRRVLAEKGVDYQAFAREAVFRPIGAASVVMETDSAGAPIGSSYVYATARDWGRLGQLYLNDGVWEGRRLLPEGWPDYVSAPTPASDGAYGAHFWLNRDGEMRRRYISGAPESLYFFSGHEGQYVFIIPDKRTVIVRTGMTRGMPPLSVVAPTVAAIVAAIGSSDEAGASSGAEASP
ncbi:serine hydrolase domain-containing protein [Amphiplicatus metriothermophilus]|uniref:CubicO group peptidase, beta-lactamase class C family n=1 Tax=Amphiplicatus metriothermophilus TaxID=1519374 RepID=A0A239PUY8_9PROT|nr:serine hydrolase [Amphiplicatus metriothermophilus]MBB5519373.1 CubicO group peptidase (beta-lactamase class C family) [Amphiplicatus metriothermophilus]SNT73497.1 CubicO group peptidase, beta-lactamase class C family [Amphiplicatus metriothermophilus]